jgi:hypothetical protein
MANESMRVTREMRMAWQKIKEQLPEGTSDLQSLLKALVVKWPGRNMLQVYIADSLSRDDPPRQAIIRLQQMAKLCGSYTLPTTAEELGLLQEADLVFLRMMALRSKSCWVE